MAAAAPRIGITTYAVNSGGDIPLPHQYVASVRRANGIPLLIPPGEKQVNQLLDAIDGIILAGGGDICPSRYGGHFHETIYMVDVERDESEIGLVTELLRRRMPTLAICRGLQVLNVALGGTLHAHLPDVVGEAVTHRLPPRVPVMHEVKLRADSRLANLMGVTESTCMSWHHQAIDQASEACCVVATAPDGVIEAIELTDRPEVLAVQWHPELTSDRDPVQQSLFNELVRLAR